MNNESQPQNIDVHVGSNHGFRNTVLGIGFTLLSVAGALVATDSFGVRDFLPDIGQVLPKFKHKSQPSKVEVGLREDTIEVEEKINAHCDWRVGAAAAVKGTKPGYNGDSSMNKLIYGDFLTCGESNTVQANVSVHKNKNTGEIVSVSYDGPGLVVTQPRVDHEDARNCAPLRVEDNSKEINKKIAKYNAKAAAGKKPSCDDGLSYSLFYVGSATDATALIHTADKAAQLALSLADISQAGNDFNVQYGTEFKIALENEYHVPATVNLSSIDSAIVQLQKVTEDLKKNFDTVEEIRDPATNKLESLKLHTASGDEVKVQTHDIDTGPVSITGLTRVVPASVNASGNKPD